eukprot:TRINITY_DN7908_c0_g1_i1.p1 TRINITY_DN7908_c0_g1~~TRINITY_DN7908_c0_g1_i1.p1  ORF type:complete len:608 (+),score=133.40 TRINITY_DN7908_c0_g1_i1:88-1824(+)
MGFNDTTKVTETEKETETEKGPEDLQSLLVELSRLHRQLDIYQLTHEKTHLQKISASLHNLLPKLGEISSNPNSKGSSQYPLLVKATNDLKSLVRRVKHLQQALITNLSYVISNSPLPRTVPIPLRGHLNCLSDNLPILLWQRRYLRLVGDTVFFFVSERATHPTDSFQIRDLIEIHPLSLGNLTLVLRARVLHLQGDNFSEIGYWSDGLKNWKNHLGHASPLTNLDTSSREKTVGGRPRSTSSDTSTIFETCEDKDLNQMLLHKLHLRQKRMNPLQSDSHRNTLTSAHDEDQDTTIPESNSSDPQEDNGEDKEKLIAALLEENHRLKTDLGLSSSSSPFPQHSANTNAFPPMSKDLQTLYEKLCQAEAQIWRSSRELRIAREELAHERKTVAALQSSFDVSKESLKLKNIHIANLSEKIKREKSNQSFNWRNKAVIALQDEIMKLKESNRAHQIQSVLLNEEIQRIQAENESKLKLKTKSISMLNEMKDQLFSNYEHLRLSLLQAQCVDVNLIEEIEDVKKELFFALATNMKQRLQNQGKKQLEEVDHGTLYQQAKNTPVSLLSDWLQNHFEFASLT